jgi:hypothetical protein
MHSHITFLLQFSQYYLMALSDVSHNCRPFAGFVDGSSKVKTKVKTNKKIKS